MREVDLSIVTYRPDLELLRALLASLAGPTRAPLRRNLFVHDNSPAPDAARPIEALARELPGAFERVDVRHSPVNVGFGRGHNANAERGDAPFILLLNQDCILEPGDLEPLVEGAENDAPRLAMWELRQIPYEHPKDYDPVTLDTSWCSGAAVLVRRAAFQAVAGFEPRLFMYGEDVDLSWRLRAQGWRLGYRPKLSVQHRTYREAAEVKPLQVFGGVQSNLCLRARFGGVARTLQGLAMLAAEIASRASFPGRRRGLTAAGLRFLWRWPYFLRTRVRPNDTFSPFFSGWGYEVRRDGAFHEFRTRRGSAPEPRPLVSILIRTVDRPAWLREALASCANQTHAPLEVVVVEDGPGSSRGVVDEFRDRLDVRFVATGAPVGRARAGNIALQTARGEWLNFLDDDDLLFADHVEVLLGEAQRAGVAGAYGLAWETQVIPRQGRVPPYDEIMHLTRHRQPFDRLILWHHNYLPIQAVLFHRRLYAKHGGFAEDMDQLEDWNLWTRYTLQDDFRMVEKTTSKYRVPYDARVAAGRQALLDRAYADAIERQRAMRLTLSPREISEMADDYLRSQTVMLVTRNDLRRFVGSSRVLTRLASYRAPAGRIIRRLAGDK